MMTSRRILSWVVFAFSGWACSYPRVDLGDIPTSDSSTGAKPSGGATFAIGTSKARPRAIGTGGSTLALGTAATRPTTAGTTSALGTTIVEPTAGGTASVLATTTAEPTSGGNTSAFGTTLPEPIPEPKVVQVAAGWYHTCALLTDGSVYCWGNNYGGQLGDGTTVDHLQPAKVHNLPGSPIVIDADYTDSCALYSDNTLWCWGSNNYGQLGDGTITRRELPTISVLGSISQISLGEYHSCALMLDGTVRCWGYNLSGGLGLSVSETRTPTPIAGISNAIQVSAGASVSCALLSDTTVSCWGRLQNSNECGSGITTHANATSMIGASNVTQIAAGSGHVCALIGDGTVSCWGSNSDGQLGETASATACSDSFSRSPAPVENISGVRQIACGSGHTCALLASGEIACWGNNASGQLGDGTTTNHASPTLVIGISNAVQISAGMRQTCAALADGMLKCWGSLFQLGDASHPPPQPYPANVTFY